MSFICFSRVHRPFSMAPRIGILLSLFILVGCYVYGPPPGPYPYYYGPSSYDRSWNAALDAMRDTGVSIVSSDYNGGIIQGTRNGVDATVRIQGQADGRVRVEFHASGPSGQDPTLADQIYRAYERRMGR
ncbi:MAG TPA: hypothetical protein VFG28_15270 [Syntrophales bacterium]|nr:hypothetical protein [Syntrophales bacterium]